MTELSIHHLLLTRFNIRSSGVGYSQNQATDWLENRFELFERFCAPSVAAQTEQNFEWIIFCDENTLVDQLDRICALDSRIRIVLVRPASRPPELNVRHHLRSRADVVISTRLDNDDALSRHAVRRIRDHLNLFIETGHARWLYNPTNGYKLDLRDGKLFEASHSSNPFLTLFERVTTDELPTGPFVNSHGRMHNMFPTYQDKEVRLWLQIIHGGNVSNSIRSGDREVPLASLRSDFPLQFQQPYSTI